MSNGTTPPGTPVERSEPAQGRTRTAAPAEDLRSTSQLDPRPADDLSGRRAVVSLQEDRYGGIKIGSAFFGWLTATGVSVLLIGLLAAGGTAIGLTESTDAGQVASDAVDAVNSGAAGDAAQTIGLVGGIALLVILFVAYACGGYVAGRMARFSGIRQGLAVWLWAVVVAILVAALAAVAGSEYDVLATLNLPRLPINEGTLTTAGIITIVAVAVTTLAGALLGGKAGMHFHRKVDRVGDEAVVTR